MADATERAEANIDESKLTVGKPKKRAVGAPAVLRAMEMSLDQMGPTRTAKTLLKVNQFSGFDCMGCAWPDPAHRRHTAEFCENGAKAVAEEATTRRVPPAFFAAHPLADLESWDDFALGKQGRLTHPMLLEAGDTHYRPVTWERAFDVIAEELDALDSPDEAVFYTSGRTSNEAAFLYQLFARALGTNNLPDCSNMCHESSGAALGETIGIGKGSVTLVDIETAGLILIAGQNPGTNHPRMLTSLEKAKKQGAVIVAVNPLREAGLLHYDNPQTVHGMVFRGTDLADTFLQIKLGGDQALFQALGKVLIELDSARGDVLDHDFIEHYTQGFEAYRDAVAALPWSEVETATGLTQKKIRKVAEQMAVSKGNIVCWAMGLTQHKHSVAMLRDVVNLLLLRGDIGKPGAGLCPVRGHSNVQGDRTMGIWEQMPAAFHDKLDAEFGFSSPREHGVDTVGAIRGMRDGTIKVFMGMGGNFAKATPDTAATEAAMRSLRLTVQVSTKLNRSHVVTGRRALILPTLGRTERDVQAGGPQKVTVEDSMSMVHESQGNLEPASRHLRSEVAIIAGLAERVLRGRTDTAHVDWRGLAGDYRRIRTHIEHVVPGFDAYEEKLGMPGGFVLPHGPRDHRTFATDTGKAKFTVNGLEYPKVPEGRLILQTMRSHDQYNTTIYGKDDRYRGIHGGRKVVLVNPKDLAALGLADGDTVDLISEAPDGERRADGWRAVAYRTPRGSAAAYYPETNVLVPLDSVADTSNTPTSKSLVIRLEKARVPVPA